MKKSVVVFGSFVVDLTSRSHGLPVPGETKLGIGFRMGPGGKGSNQAVAAHRAGADVTLVTRIGRDALASVAMDFYKSEGMDTGYVLVDEQMPTGAALVMVDDDSAQNAIVVTGGALQGFTLEEVEACRPLLERADYLLLQHEIDLKAQYAAQAIAHKSGAKIVLNPAPALEIPDDVLRRVDYLTPNETEAAALTGIPVTDVESAERAADILLGRGVGTVIITLGNRGVYAKDATYSGYLPAMKVQAVDTTGAGDAFNGCFVAALADGMELKEALRFANAGGALSVTKHGTAPAMPTRAEIEAFLS